MITQAHAASLKEQGVDFISALKSVQIRSLVNSGDLQLSLFDEVNLAEITSPLFAGERLVVCRNPAVAAERARKRTELLAATEVELAKVKASVEGLRGRLRAADAGKIGERAGKIINKYKVAKHFTLTITDGTFAYQRKTDQINQEAALDGLYAIRTTLPAETLGAPAAGRAYKQLKMSERAFGTMKDTIEIRPIHHHLETRVRAHVFLCMLAYYVSFELQTRLPELLFTDDTPRAQADPVKPATRSASAHKKAGSATTTNGYPAHTLTDLLADLGTLCRNTVRIGHAEHTFTRLTTPTPLQAAALGLLDVKLHEQPKPNRPATPEPRATTRDSTFQMRKLPPKAQPPGPVPDPGRDHRRPQRRRNRGGHRLGADLAVVRPALRGHPGTGRVAAPCGRRGRGARPRRGTRARRGRGARSLPPVSCDPRGPATPPRPRRRGGDGIPSSNRAHRQLGRAPVPAGPARGSAPTAWMLTPLCGEHRPSPCHPSPRAGWSAPTEARAAAPPCDPGATLFPPSSGLPPLPSRSTTSGFVTGHCDTAGSETSASAGVCSLRD